MGEFAKSVRTALAADLKSEQAAISWLSATETVFHTGVESSPTCGLRTLKDGSTDVIIESSMHGLREVYESGTVVEFEEFPARWKTNVRVVFKCGGTFVSSPQTGEVFTAPSGRRGWARGKGSRQFYGPRLDIGFLQKKDVKMSESVFLKYIMQDYIPVVKPLSLR
jgi:hypothetical protein